MGTLTLDRLIGALSDRPRGDVAAVRFRTVYQPTAGPGTKVFPPTYATGGRIPYVLEPRLTPDGRATWSVLLDSVASQANRVEEALLDEIDAGRLELPLISLHTDVHGRRIRLTSLEAPHRVADAYFRDAVTPDGEPFDRTDLGKALRLATLRDATAVYRCCPTALIFGAWDSHRGRPELSFKAPRVYVSEVTAEADEPGSKVGSRLDPLGMLGGTVKRDEDPREWRLVEIEGEQTKEQVGDTKAKGKTDKLSNVGHGNVPPTVTVGGIAIRDAVRAASLSFAGLRRLRFPVDGERREERDAAGRAVLAALALAGDRLTWEVPDVSFRSGCDLVVTEDRVELLHRQGEAEPLDLDVDKAYELLSAAVAAASSQGLDWLEEPIVLNPRANLQEALEANLLLAE